MRLLHAVVPAGVIGVLGLFAWGLLREDGAPRVTPVMAPAQESANQDEIPTPASSPAIEATRSDAAAVVEDAEHPSSLLTRLLRARARNPPLLVFQQGPYVLVDFEVIVTDANGVEHATESGKATPGFSNVVPLGDGTSTTFGWGAATVGVSGGSFHVEVPARCKVAIHQLELGGRPAVCDSNSIAVEEGQRVTIHARWIEGVTLHVVDAASGVDLNGVTVVQNSHSLPGGGVHPGDQGPMRIMVASAASPFLLFPAQELFGITLVDSYWVGASGHAWKLVPFDFTDPIDERVELGPAATLIVDVNGELPSRVENFLRPSSSFSNAGVRASVLRVRTPTAPRRNDEAPIAQFLAKLGSTRIDGLPPGDIVVSIEVGEGPGPPLVAGEVAATLVAGGTTHVELKLPPIEQAEHVPLAGTLFVPPTWNRGDLALQIRPMDLHGAGFDDITTLDLREMQPLSGRQGWLRWDAGTVEPARYQLAILNSGTSIEIDVAPPGREDVEIELQDAAQLTVTLVDEATGAEVELRRAGWSLAWLPASDDENDFYGREVWFNLSVALDHAIAFRRFAVTGTGPNHETAFVPVGLGELVVNDAEWLVGDDAQREIAPGAHELVFHLRRAPALELQLACSGRPVRWPTGSIGAARIEPIGHSGHSTRADPTETGATLHVSAPGRYRVKVPSIPGYVAVEPIEVELLAREHVQRVIELRRR